MMILILFHSPSRCILDGSPRWTKTVPPAPNSFISVLGAFHGQHTEGFPAFLVHSLALNVPSSGPVNSPQSDDDATLASPSKRLFELPPPDPSPSKRSNVKVSTSSVPAAIPTAKVFSSSDTVASTSTVPRVRTKKTPSVPVPPSRSSISVEPADMVVDDPNTEEVLAPAEPQLSPRKRGRRK